MTFVEFLPHLNASLNATSTVCLLAGYIAIKRGRRDLHPRWMIAAFSASSLFLVFYLLRFALTGPTHFPDVGLVKTLYLALLFSHMLLAVVVVPLVVRALYLGLKSRYVEHRRLTRITFPIWLYVSVTGVLVYVMLYHVAKTLR